MSAGDEPGDDREHRQRNQRVDRLAGEKPRGSGERPGLLERLGRIGLAAEEETPDGGGTREAELPLDPLSGGKRDGHPEALGRLERPSAAVALGAANVGHERLVAAAVAAGARR
jgi:hypothetical protein